MYKLYHNPRCGKSRTCLTYFETNGIEFELKPYLKTGISANEVVQLMQNYAGNPLDLIRTNEPEWKTLNPSDQSMEQLAKLVEQHPILLQRPLVATADTTIIARPLENIEAVGLSI